MGATATVLGLFTNWNCEVKKIAVGPGDVLVIYTDGVTEALNPKEEEFGEERLRNLLRRSAHLPVGEMASAITTELKKWMDTAAQYDDLTFILVKVNPQVG